jgi:hypothetical protein
MMTKKHSLQKKTLHQKNPELPEKQQKNPELPEKQRTDKVKKAEKFKRPVLNLKELFEKANDGVDPSTADMVEFELQ